MIRPLPVLAEIHFRLAGEDAVVETERVTERDAMGDTETATVGGEIVTVEAEASEMKVEEADVEVEEEEEVEVVVGTTVTAMEEDEVAVATND